MTGRGLVAVAWAKFQPPSPIFKVHSLQTSLVVQWLWLHVSNAGYLDSIPGEGTRSHMSQLRVCMPWLKIPHAATETWCSQINKEVYFIYFF